MSNIRFLGPTNLWTASTTVLTASSTADGYPASNSQNTDRNTHWRSQAASTVTLVADLGTAQAVTCVGVANMASYVNGISSLTGSTLQASSDNSNWIDIGSMPTADAQRKVSFLFTGMQTYRYWRLYFHVPVISPLWEVGYVFLGTYLEPTKNPRMPLDRAIDDLSVVTDGPSGFRVTSEQPQYATGSWRFEYVQASDRTNLLAFLASVKQGTPYFAVLDPTDVSRAWLQYAGTPIDDAIVKNDRYSVGWPWREAPTR